MKSISAAPSIAGRLFILAALLLSSCDDQCIIGVTDDPGIEACGEYNLALAVSIDDRCTNGEVTATRGARTAVVARLDSATLLLTFPDYFSGGALRQTIAAQGEIADENGRAEVWMVDHSTGRISSSRYAVEPGQLVIVSQIDGSELNCRFECDLRDSTGTLLHRLRNGGFRAQLR